MFAKWGTCTILAFSLTVLLLGCRTPQPNLKPPTTAERLVEPPERLAVAGIRKEALDSPDDPAKRAFDMKGAGNMPGGRAGGMGPGGMGGSR